jgi:hypothetical protein
MVQRGHVVRWRHDVQTVTLKELEKVTTASREIQLH